jgi:hypothetical protein
LCKPYHYAIVEAVEPFKLYPKCVLYIYKVFEHLRLLWMDIWLHNHTITTTNVSPDLGELAEIIGNVVCKPCHYTMVEVVEPFKLYPKCVLYIYKVFQNLHLLWMDMAAHSH